MIKTLCLFLLLTLIAMPAHALTFEQGADAPTRTIEDYIKDYVDVPEGALDWKVLGATKSIEIAGLDTKTGLQFQYFKPDFMPDVKALDGKEITIKGFMFPLESADDQKLFLFGPFPVNCPFQYHVGPNLVIEAHADKNPVTFSYDPLVLKGTLELVPEDSENSTFYRLKNVQLIK